MEEETKNENIEVGAGQSMDGNSDNFSQPEAEVASPEISSESIPEAGALETKPRLGWIIWAVAALIVIAVVWILAA